MFFSTLDMQTGGRKYLFTQFIKFSYQYEMIKNL